jgi:hypothetical protein
MSEPLAASPEASERRVRGQVGPAPLGSVWAEGWLWGGQARWDTHIENGDDGGVVPANDGGDVFGLRHLGGDELGRQ